MNRKSHLSLLVILLSLSALCLFVLAGTTRAQTQQQIADAVTAEARRWTLGNPLPETPRLARTSSRDWGFARWQGFERGRVYWFDGSVNVVTGAILATYGASGYENGPLGLPMSDEIACEYLNPLDRLSVFQSGRIYWEHATGRTFTMPGPPENLSIGREDALYILDRRLGMMWKPGTCFPKVRLWLEPSGIYDLNGAASMWVDHVNRIQAGTSQSGFWPQTAVVNGMSSLQLRERKGLPVPTSLANTPYTLFAVVRRDSNRGENYFLKSDGIDCGLLGCKDNSALHVGWVNDRTIRFGQYYNDLDLQNVPAFNRDRPVISLITAVSDTTEKMVWLDEPGFSAQARKQDGRLLRPGSGQLHVGASSTQPAYWFSGNVLELIICDARLPDFMVEAMKRHLRAKYRI